MECRVILTHPWAVDDSAPRLSNEGVIRAGNRAGDRGMGAEEGRSPSVEAELFERLLAPDDPGLSKPAARECIW